MGTDAHRPVTAWLGIGSNVDAERNVRAGVALLAERFASIRLSPVYRSPAIGFAGDDFLNLVAAVETTQPLPELCATLAEVEVLRGRTRGGPRFAPRPLDIDLLLYGDLVCEEGGVVLPRPDVLRYAFVLRPLAELEPTLVHPVTGRTMREHWEAFDAPDQPLWPVPFEWEGPRP